jgi:hypothetical protein
MPLGRSTRRGRRALSPVGYLRHKAVVRSLSGSGRWMVVGGALWVGGRVRRAISRQPESVVLPMLRVGETLEVTARRPLTRRQRRAVRRAH